MSPDDRARYYLAYEAAYPFGLFGCTASELDGVAEEMREVAEAADLAAAAAVLDDYEYGGDNRAAARAIRAFLDIVDPPDPDTVEALVQRWSAALAGLAECSTTYGPNDADALCAATERLVERMATAERERDEARAERDAARRLLAACYVLSGADPDGDGWEHLWPYAVREVWELRDNYDAMLRDTGDEAVIRAERDRLQAILDAERGVGGPEGWVYDRHGSGAWRRIDGSASVINPCRGVWSWRRGRIMEDAPTALEAMEAADAAVRGAE